MKNNGSHGDNTIKLIIGGLLLALVCFAMGKVQSLVQVVLGLVSFPVSFGITLGIALALTSVGITVNALPIAILRPFAVAFFAAGFTLPRSLQSCCFCSWRLRSLSQRMSTST